MFQPQPTPYSSSYSSYGIHIANAEVPEYAFQPTPLAQFGTGHAGSGGIGAGAGSVPISVAAGRSASTDLFASHIFHSHNPGHLSYNSSNINHNATIPHRHHQNHRGIKMEPQHSADLAQQEAAAQEFKPQLEGPLVGDRKPSTVITEEYAKADPIFVAKTMALPETYSHYRPIQGDGNCGWRVPASPLVLSVSTVRYSSTRTIDRRSTINRLVKTNSAIAFAYFETLVRSGDMNQIQGELARLTSLNTYIESVGGHASWMFEDMVSETFELFNAVITAMSNGQDPMPFVMEKFNNLESAQNLVYHQRLLASSWLKGNPSQYEPWIAGTVDSYIQDTILPIDREIDHIGVVLLHDVLMKPAGIVLEIAYLDRSEGSVVNVHRMPEETINQDPAVLGPMVYLLYRPGHYDILYRDSIIQAPPMPPPPTTLSINRATSFTHHHEIENTMPIQDFSVDMSALSMIPGFGTADMSPLGSPTAPSPMTDPYAPSPQSPWMAQPFTDGLATGPPPPQPSPPQQVAAVHHPLRFSKYNFPDLVESPFHEPAFQTNTFKNSHFNVAHYNNMNFQPEMYRPEAEEEIPHGKGSGRKRSSEHCAVIKKENRG